jgi:DNA invertase Pin-like site-specific DNA recombinase
MKLGYARVSTEDQNLEIQCGRLSEAGCEMMFEEKISGSLVAGPSLKS